MSADAAAALREEARRADERRALVLAGDREAGYEAARAALSAAGVDFADATLVGERDALPCERVAPVHADRLLGTTRSAVVVDAHDTCPPNVLGRVVGAVGGGGLFVLVTPPLDAWPDRRDGFDASLAVPPFEVADVAGHFRRRLVETIRAHRGVAVVDVDAGAVGQDGLTDPPPRRPRPAPTRPPDAAFPGAAYDACLTRDQTDAVAALEALRDSGTAVVVEADRGRGKSAAAGIAAACLAAEGREVVVTAPGYRNAREVFVRCAAVCRALDALDSTDGDPPRSVTTTAGGAVRWASPGDAATEPGSVDALLVDEAAALPVRRLTDFLAADAVAFATTVHGYEGAGRGFDVRFRDRLDESGRDVRTVALHDPVRHAPGDPVESWAFHALLLDARPAVDPLVTDAVPADATYRAPDAEALLADEHLLREAFGLLVTAHYRTEPNDLARLLDAPNLSVRALTVGGHVVSVALLAREGGLGPDRRAAMYEGERVRGNMIPDVLTSQLRDEDAAATVGWRVVRIATHHACRSRGFGSRLLGEVRRDADGDADWLGVGFGATPRLLDFWRENGYGTVHLSTTRNDASGEYSAVLLDPLTPAGERLHDRHAAWFAERSPGVLSDALRDLDPDVARAALRACAADPLLDLSAREWRVVAGAARGPGLYGVDPAPFRRLVRTHLVAGDSGLLSAREERLLVTKLLQARPLPSVADELDYHSTGEAMRALGDALRSLVEAHGSDAARTELSRFDD
jgi:tRNA(Met) cytidine acetyltransferase